MLPSLPRYLRQGGDFAVARPRRILLCHPERLKDDQAKSSACPEPAEGDLLSAATTTTAGNPIDPRRPVEERPFQGRVSPPTIRASAPPS
ncbi:MAG: hypothetical protein WBF04_24375 [Candidatus Sulfotelmatobacter sp.]